MNATAFVDTNVLVYAVDADEPSKQKLAVSLLYENAGRLVLSAQVLAEFYVTVTRKLHTPLPPAEAAQRVDELSRMPVVPIDASLVNAAIHLADEASLSYWDAAIIAAASNAGCDRLLSEDLQSGMSIAGVRVVNPFS